EPGSDARSRSRIVRDGSSLGRYTASIVTRDLPVTSGSAQSRTRCVPANGLVSSHASRRLTNATATVSARSSESANAVTRSGGALITTRSAAGSGAKAGRVVLGLQATTSHAHAAPHAPRSRHVARISVCEAAFPVGACAARPPSTYRWEQRRVHHGRALPPARADARPPCS